MKKIIFTIAACLLAVMASAQPMGGRPMGGGRPPMGAPRGAGMGMEKPFYEQESDSIANARIQDVAVWIFQKNSLTRWLNSMHRSLRRFAATCRCQ